MPQLTQLLRAGLRTGPLWSNLEPGCCDDPEGAAETRWPMVSQVRTHTHTRARGLHLCSYRSQREPEGNQERPKESRGLIRRRGHTLPRPGNPFPGKSDSTLLSSPWTQELAVRSLCVHRVGSRIMPSQGFGYDWTPLLSVIRGK